MCGNNYSRGSTLFELMMVMLVSMLVAAFSVQMLDQLVLRIRLESTQRLLLDALASSRHAALALGRPVTLCGSASGRDCERGWRQGLLVFEDRDHDGVHDAGERVMASEALAGQGIWLEWRSFRGHDFLQWSPQGYATASNGTFTLCNSRRQKSLLRQLVINRAGRVRLLMPDRHGGETLIQAMRVCGW